MGSDQYIWVEGYEWGVLLSLLNRWGAVGSLYCGDGWCAAIFSRPMWRVNTFEVSVGFKSGSHIYGSTMATWSADVFVTNLVGELVELERDSIAEMCWMAPWVSVG